jgi:hypothetical protein
MERPGSITSSINPKKEYDKILIIKDLLLLAKNTGSQPEKAKIYKDRCKDLWIAVYGFCLSHKKKYPVECTEICSKLQKLSCLLLHRATLKNYLLFLLVLLLRVHRVTKIHSAFRSITQTGKNK